VEIQAFPGCCGAGVVFALDDEYARQRENFPNPPAKENLTSQETLQRLKEKIDAAKLSHWGLLTATTNEHQTETEKLLESVGFQLTHKFNNPMHNNAELKLWVLNLYFWDLKTKEYDSTHITL